MNAVLLAEAMDHIDSDLIERYFRTKERMSDGFRKKRKKTVKRWLLAAACLLLAMGITYGISYVPVTPDIDYEYDESQMVARIKSNVWIYYVGPLGTMHRERVKIYGNMDCRFEAWKQLNGLGEEVRLVERIYEDNYIQMYDENGVWQGVTTPEDFQITEHLTVSAEIRNYKNYERLLRSLELTVLDCADICYITVE